MKLIKHLSFLNSIFGLFALTTFSHGAIILVAEYHLGEAGSLTAGTNNPLDSSTAGTPSGNQNLSSEISGSSATVGTAGVYAPGSSAYLDTSGASNTGWFQSGALTTLSLDNFAFGVYARASSLGGTQGDVMTLGGGNGAFKLSLDNNGWAASAHNASWIGTANGISGSFTANTWVHLALVRTSGTTTFYINGVSQATYAGAPVHDTIHMSVNPGGTTYFDGLIDEARIATFAAADAGAGNINVLNALQAVPETSVTMLGVLGSLLFMRRRR